jgi:GNAT superfamily N-acetyltransferase
MIALATPDDISGIADLLRSMHAENGQAQVNERKALGVISQHIESGGCLVARQRDEIVGSMGVYVGSWWYSDEEAFFTRWFYVHPKHRSEGHATRLIGGMKQASRVEGKRLFVRIGAQASDLASLKHFKKYLVPFEGGYVFNPGSEAMVA